MAKKYRNKAQENSRVIRIPLSTYAALRQLATDAQVSVGAVVEALAKLEPIEKRKPVVPGAQMWFRVTPPPPQFNLDVKPKSNIEIISQEMKGGGMAKLEEFYVFVMEGPMPGDESVINLQAVNSTGDMLWLPLATHNSSELGRLKELAEGIGGQVRRDIKLLKFTRGEEIIG